MFTFQDAEADKLKWFRKGLHRDSVKLTHLTSGSFSNHEACLSMKLFVVWENKFSPMFWKQWFLHHRPKNTLPYSCSNIKQFLRSFLLFSWISVSIPYSINLALTLKVSTGQERKGEYTGPQSHWAKWPNRKIQPSALTLLLFYHQWHNCGDIESKRMTEKMFASCWMIWVALNLLSIVLVRLPICSTMLDSSKAWTPKWSEAKHFYTVAKYVGSKVSVP